jgi:hypothetical protein
LQHSSVAQSHKESGESFLPDILNRLGRLQAGTQLNLDQSSKIRAEMLLSAEVAGSETLEIGLVEGLKLQRPAPQTQDWGTV